MSWNARPTYVNMYFGFQEFGENYVPYPIPQNSSNYVRECFPPEYNRFQRPRYPAQQNNGYGQGGFQYRPPAPRGGPFTRGPPVSRRPPAPLSRVQGRAIRRQRSARNANPMGRPRGGVPPPPAFTCSIRPAIFQPPVRPTEEPVFQTTRSQQSAFYPPPVPTPMEVPAVPLPVPSPFQGAPVPVPPPTQTEPIPMQPPTQTEPLPIPMQPPTPAEPFPMSPPTPTQPLPVPPPTPTEPFPEPPPTPQEYFPVPAPTVLLSEVVVPPVPMPVPVPITPPKPFEVEIICLDARLQRYVEEVESKIKEMDLTVQIKFALEGKFKLLSYIGQLNREGTLFAFVIGTENATHRSITMYALYGALKPESLQEHRDMGLHLAYALMKKMLGKMKFRAVSEELVNMVNTVLKGEFLMDNMYPSLIELIVQRWKLQRQLEERIDFEEGTQISSTEVELMGRIMSIIGVSADEVNNAAAAGSGIGIRPVFRLPPTPSPPLLFNS